MSDKTYSRANACEVREREAIPPERGTYMRQPNSPLVFRRKIGGEL